MAYTIFLAVYKLTIHSFISSHFHFIIKHVPYDTSATVTSVIKHYFSLLIEYPRNRLVISIVLTNCMEDRMI